MTKKIKLVSGVLAGVLISGIAFAQKAGPHKRKLSPESKRTVVDMFQRVDLDGDGEIVAEEWFIHIKDYSFRKLDRNGNGMVSRPEWDAFETGPDADALFARWDKNRDGKLSKAEFRDTPRAKEILQRLFRTVDRNADRKLDMREFIDRADADE